MGETAQGRDGRQNPQLPQAPAYVAPHVTGAFALSTVKNSLIHPE